MSGKRSDEACGGQGDARRPRTELERIEAAVHRFLVSGPDHSTLTLSKRGGSVRVEAAAVHGNALELLEGFTP